MNRRSPCDCEYCRQYRVQRQAEVTRLYQERAPRPRDPYVTADRVSVALVTLFFALAILGVAASWWVRT